MATIQTRKCGRYATSIVRAMASTMPRVSPQDNVVRCAGMVALILGAVLAAQPLLHPPRAALPILLLFPRDAAPSDAVVDAGVAPFRVKPERAAARVPVPSGLSERMNLDALEASA